MASRKLSLASGVYYKVAAICLSYVVTYATNVATRYLWGGGVSFSWTFLHMTAFTLQVFEVRFDTCNRCRICI